MSSKGRIQFPREFLVQSARRDYQDITRAFLREFMQNSRDAKAKNIELVIRLVGGEGLSGRLVFECNDDGIGMNKEVIETKLMAMGGTTKSGDADAVGSLGVAKLACYFCHDDYQIETQSWVVRGSGSDYEVSTTHSFVKGCRAKVTINPAVISASADNLAQIYRQEIARSYLPGIAITLNGEAVHAAKKSGRRCHDFGSGVTLHKTTLGPQETTNYVSVRARGLHMFDLYVNDCRHEMVVELQGYSSEILTSNRDGFRREWQSRVSSLVQQLNLNSNAADKAQVHHYQGRYSRRPADMAKVIEQVNLVVRRLVTHAQAATVPTAYGQDNHTGQDGQLATTVLGITGADLDAFRSEVESIATVGGLSGDETRAVAAAAATVLERSSQEAVRGGGEAGYTELTEEEVGLGSRPLHHYYVETKGKFRGVPAKWQEENLGSRHRMLLETWAAVLGLVLAHSGKAPSAFDVGFVLDDGSEGDTTRASYGKLNGRHVFFINPLKVGKGEASQLPLTRSARLSLIMILKALAEHEVTHFTGQKWHDESFTSAEMTLRHKTGTNIKDYIALAKKKND